MNTDPSIVLIAPCGITCGACYAHLRTKNTCAGCRVSSQGQPKHCQTCKIRACATEQHLNFCADCSKFPCILMKRIDKRYQTRYRVSLIANGLRLKAIGVEAYVAEEIVRWTCRECGSVISLHSGVCSGCGTGK